jgi:uncharacterized membrane protein YkoI
MKRIILTIAVASLAIGGIAVAQTRAPAHHQARAEAEEGDEADEAEDNAALAARAKLTLVQAQDIALRARAGEVKDHELEAERGGSGLRYSFDILSGGKTFEVGVDAETGAVLENAEEGPNPE